VIANNNEDDFKKGLPEKLVFEPGEFGWEFERYDNVKWRASYLFTAILNNSMCDKYIPVIKETLQKWGVEAIFPETTKEYSQYSKKPYDVLANDKNSWYYIDHSGELDEFLERVCNDEVLLMNFLFSEESFIATGNDNSDQELDDETNAKNVLYEYYKDN
jgi:hypothetical protein